MPAWPTYSTGTPSRYTAALVEFTPPVGVPTTANTRTDQHVLWTSIAGGPAAAAALDAANTILSGLGPRLAALGV